MIYYNMERKFAMNYYTKDFEVDIHDVDFNGIARTSALMRIIQSTAQSQLTDNNMSYDQLKSSSRAFILARMKMEFTEPVRAYELLKGVSFPCHSRGYSFLRCYQLLKEDRVIGRAVSAWALVDTNTHALIKVNDFDLGLEVFSPLDLTLSRFSLPEDMRVVGTYNVTYDRVDQNHHMNNTRYPDMYSNFLDLNGKRIAEITINYSKEAPEGDTLTVYYAKLGEYHYFKTVRSDGLVNSEAEIRTVDI